MSESDSWNADQHFEKARKCMREALSHLTEGDVYLANEEFAAACLSWGMGLDLSVERHRLLGAAARPEDVDWTIRQGIKAYRGGFYRALLRAHELDHIFALMLAHRVADSENQEWLDEQFPRIAELSAVFCGWPMNMQGGIERAFPGMASLDMVVPDPTSVDLREPVEKEGGEE